MAFEIDDLRTRPEFAHTVAERIWQAWWRGKGYPLEHLTGLVAANLDPAGRIPFALVAHRQGQFVGTVSVVTSDMDERPDLSPWVAALWVDADYRGKGAGSSLVLRAREAVFALGFSPVYLCATPENSAFYRRQDWTCAETGVAGLNIFSFHRPDGRQSPAALTAARTPPPRASRPR